MKQTSRIVTSTVAALFALGVVDAPAQENDRTLEGVWAAERYVLRDGPTHQVTGRIFFTQTEWTVLFFVVDEDGEPRRGSGEGGSYTLQGNRLVFSHLFNLSTGEAMAGLPASPLRMESRAALEAQTEPSTIEVSGDRLTIAFPSGNAMVFRRLGTRG